MKHYLIDSENVGDFWIPLLELPADQAELIVFYTKNSPHMSYDSLIRLKESDRTVTFIKCYEGTNALDFQLCSELGFLIAGNEGDDFIIVTNDTGYDAAVKYWRHKDYSVKRIAGKDTRTGSRRRGTPARFDVAAEVNSILHKLNRTPEPEEDEDEIESGLTETERAPEEFEPAEDIEDSGYEEESADAETEDDFDGDEEPYDPDSDVPEEEDDLSTESSEEEETLPNDEDPEEDEDEEQYGDPDEYIFETDDTKIGTPEPAEMDRIAQEPDAEISHEEEQEESEDAAAVTAEAEPEEAGTVEEESGEEAAAFIPDREEITAIVNCIGMDNLAELHNQLIQFYGDNGKDIYLSLKSGSLSIDKQDWDKEDKFLYYCALILRHSDEPEESLEEENIREFAQFLLSVENKRKNLNSLRYALLKHYGKEKGRRYYFMLKPYVKALNQM